MLIGGTDFESTGLKVQDDHIIQVGFVLWDTKAPTLRKKAKIKYDALIRVPNIGPLDSAVCDVHGISDTDLVVYGEPPEVVFERLLSLMSKADALCAHNGTLFDHPIFKHNLERYGFSDPEQLWIDTSCDVDYPAHITTRKLTYLAVEHGFINPFPHDATSDVLTMLNVADRYDWDKTFKWAKSPTITVRAETSFQQKELAKKQNFRWNADNKMWVKSIKDFQLAEVEKTALASGFKVSVLQERVT